MEPVVAVQSCTRYDRDAVDAAVGACFDALGGLEALVRPGTRVFCKANLLLPATPEQAVTTHPEVVRAVVRRIRRLGGIPVVGDNPAATKMLTGLRRSGILAVLEEEKVEVPDLGAVVRLENPEGKAFRSFEVSKVIADCDVLLNLPKLKTHALMYMTGAVKNCFGLFPGLEKARWHLRAPSAQDFAVFVCDLYGALLRHFDDGRRMLHLCDGILAMEGDGPSFGGSPRELGALLASFDATALDRVACALTGLDPARLAIVHEAAHRGFGEGDLARIRCVGAPLETWSGVKFVPPSGSGFPGRLSQWATRNPWLKNRILERPFVDAEKCGGCGKCREICPPQAITMSGDKPARPEIDLDACIRCYCCAEVCPEAAMHKSGTPLLGRALAALG